MIGAALHSVSTLHAQAGEAPSADDLRTVLDDESATLTAAVEGWASAPTSAELRAALTALAAAERDLRGELGLLSQAARILRQIVDDGYGSSVFIRLLREKPKREFTAANRGDDLPQLMRALTAHLHGNASLYFLAKYREALDTLGVFVETATAALTGLDPAKLLRAGRAHSPTSAEPHTGATIEALADELRTRLNALSLALPPVTIKALSDRIDVISVSTRDDIVLARLEAQPT